MLGKRVPARVNEGFCDRPGHRRRSPCPSSPSSTPIELRARTASFKWQVSPLLLYSLPWHRARTEPSRKVSCQSSSCRARLFGGSREKCFAFRSRSVGGAEYVTGFTSTRLPLIFSAVGIVVCFVANVLGVRKPLLYAIVEVEGDQFARGPHAGLEHSSICRLLTSQVGVNRRNASA